MSKNVANENVEYFSPYKAAKYVNSELENAGISKKIPPQMMYNYTVARINAGKKPFIAFDVNSGVNEEALKEWTKNYILKKKVLQEAGL